ncbi:MAG: phosphoadenosine phosphosulfate reductase family protein [Candidatus Nezhaarchaeota archaeon]|nr:phosphoadenosine phosphosulfate reductase family protein [Candidatus Nezhaarchaeota archaeon]
MKKPWLIAADLYWCRGCEAPLLEPRCSRCGSVVSRLHASPPRDVRPAFPSDVERVAKSIRAELGDEAEKVLLPSGCLVLLNKVAYVDQADEVIVGGWPIGLLYYNPEQRRWRFKPAAEGAARMWRSEVGYWAQIKRSSVRQWASLSPSEVARGSLPERVGSYVYLVSPSGQAVGLAVWTGEALKVVKAWSPQSPHSSPRGSSWRAAVEANEEALRRAEARARSFIANVSKRFSDKPKVVSFSGGKDSLACLILCLRELGETPLLFNDTGLELPETVRHVEEVASRLSLELQLASAEDAFWRALPNFGPPARDYRWCCKVCKLVPIAELMRRRFNGGVLTFLGQRRLESFARARSPPVAASRWVKGSVIASPISDWAALHVWLFLMKEGAEVNPLYAKGFDRVGCWLCPASELAELRLVEALHPELWEPWEEWLRSWASKHGLPPRWVELGLWRWRRLPGDQRKLAKRAGLEAEGPSLPMEVVAKLKPEACLGGLLLKAKISPPPRLVAMAALAPVAKAKASLLGQALLLKAGPWSATLSNSGELKIKALGVEEAEEALRGVAQLAARTLFCLRCGSCALHCPRGCISLGPGLKIDPGRCAGCGECSRACPAVVYVAHGALKRRQLSA